MARELLLARYAQALFSLAHERGLVNTVEDDLTQFDNLVATRELSQLIFHPKVEKQAKKALISKLGVEFNAITIDFLNLLVDKRREAAVSGITKHFKGLAIAERGEVHAAVISARKLSSQETTELAASLGTGGKKVVLQESVDPSLLGGLIVRVGNKIYDGSVDRRLRSLKHKLSQVQVRIAEVKDVAP